VARRFVQFVIFFSSKQWRTIQNRTYVNRYVDFDLCNTFAIMEYFLKQVSQCITLNAQSQGFPDNINRLMGS